MPLAIDLTGKKFGRWTVLTPSGVDSRGYWQWNCVCFCGSERVVSGRSLRNGKSKSCGCRGRGYQHGMSGTPTFKSWESMLQRCLNKKSPDYPRYGGAGIKVCRRWSNSWGKGFINFLADMGVRPLNTSLDRFPDKYGNYEPGNCRWASRFEQQLNKGNSRTLTWGGETKPIIEWSMEKKIPYDLLLRRVNRGVTNPFAPSRSKKVSRFTG